MGFKFIINQIGLDTLTDPQKKAIRKILSDQKREIESELKQIDRALGKKRKTKRPAKR
jgi:AAA+ ATPase superfamily predicted ATPase